MRPGSRQTIASRVKRKSAARAPASRIRAHVFHIGNGKDDQADPEPWQTNATAPFLTIERPRGTVSVWSLGRERFRVQAPRDDAEVEGFDQARAAAHRLAAGLD
jgi:hypothetical protein